MSDEIQGDPRAQLLGRLESLRRAGVTHLPKAPATALEAPARQPDRTAAPATEPEAPSAPPAEASEPAAPGPVEREPLEPPQPAGATASATLFEEGEADLERPDLSREERVGALKTLSGNVAGCSRCQELATTRTQTVFGVGNPEARLCFVGEAPGADEDRQGEPFVGRAGQLLNRIIQACGMQRDDVYICNILKCRPPGNRNPEPEESRNCRGFLERQLEIVQPDFICCLGGVAAKELLGVNLPMHRLRGRLHDYRGIPVVCTYHPAYLLRNPQAKRPVWEDMQMLMKEMGIEIPQRGGS